MVTPMVKRGHTEVERIWVSAPRARCVSGEWTGGTGCPREGDQNCAQSEGGLGEEAYQRPECSAQAGARGCYFGRNLGLQQKTLRWSRSCSRQSSVSKPKRSLTATLMSPDA